MAFDRDLGYLWKFFDNLDAHAESQGLDALKQFMAEERERWQSIVPMLNDSEQAPEEVTEPIAAAQPEKPKPSRLSYRPEPPRLKPIVPKAAQKEAPTGFTVGSLIEYR